MEKGKVCRLGPWWSCWGSRMSGLERILTDNGCHVCMARFNDTDPGEVWQIFKRGKGRVTR